MRAVRVDTAFGFIFVALRGEPAPLAEMWGPLLEEFTPYRTEEMVPVTMYVKAFAA